MSLKERIKRFLLGSAGGAIIAFLLYIGLIEIGVLYVVSAGSGKIVGFGLNFIVQKRWAFKNKDNYKKQITYAIYLFLALFLSTLIGLEILVEYVGLGHKVAYLVVKLILAVPDYLGHAMIFKDEVISDEPGA